jgi:hypothetical protein
MLKESGQSSQTNGRIQSLDPKIGAENPKKLNGHGHVLAFSQK